MRQTSTFVIGLASLALVACAGTDLESPASQSSPLTAGGYTTRATAQPASVSAGDSTRVNVEVESASNSRTSVGIDVEIVDANGVPVLTSERSPSKLHPKRATRFSVDWNVPATQAPGQYAVRVSVRTTSGRVLHRNDNATTIVVKAPPAPTEPEPTEPEPTEPGPTEPAPTTPATLAVPIYEDAIAPGFANWSWSSTIDPLVSNPVFEGNRSLGFTANAPWGGLYLRSSSPIDTTPLKAVRFAIRATAENQRLKVLLYGSNGATLNSGAHLANHGGTPPVGSWRVYEIPLTALGATPGVSVIGVAIQDAAGIAQPTVYIDGLGFTASTTQPAPTEPAPTEPAPTEPAPTEPAPTEPEPTQPAPTPTDPALLKATIDRMTTSGFGSVTRSALESEFGSRFDYYAGSTELAVVADGTGKALRQRYVPTSSGSKVVEFPASIPSANEMWLSYRIYFEPGWEWKLGGKLPGLAGGTHPTGGSFDDNGFSARLMWRANGAISVYAYHHDRPEKWGQDFYLTNSDGSRWSAPIGRWFTVRERIKMNSNGSTKDGEVEVWIDGVRKLRKTGLRWRMNTNYGVDTLMYSSFYGGGSPEWAPSKTTYARFDDFKVAKTAGGVD